MPATAVIERWLGWASWAVIPLAVLANLAVKGLSADPSRVIVLGACAVFFALLLGRLGMAAFRQATQRRPLALLMTGVVLWGAESVRLQPGQAGAGPRHLAPGELAYVGAYLAFALYLLIAPD